MIYPNVISSIEAMGYGKSQWRYGGELIILFGTVRVIWGSGLVGLVVAL